MALTINPKNWRTLFTKTKTRSQVVEVLTEDGRGTQEELLAKRGCCCSDDKYSAWILDDDNQYMDEDTRQYTQLVGERSCSPICLYKERDEFKIVPDSNDSKRGLHKLVTGIFEESVMSNLIELNRDHAKQSFMNAAMWIFGIPIVLAALAMTTRIFMK